MKKGFTLLEMMVVLLLVSVVFAALFMVLSTGRTTWSEADTQIALQHELRKATSEIMRYLSQSGSTQVSCPKDGNPYPTISFNISRGVSGSGVINWTTTPINYSVTGGQLLEVRGASSRVIANNVTSLTFTRQDATPRFVAINVTVQKNTQFNRLINASESAAVYLRN